MMQSAAAIAILFLLPLISNAFSLDISSSSRREIIRSGASGSAALSGLLIAPSLALAAEDEFITTDRGIKYVVVSPPVDASSNTPVRGQKVRGVMSFYNVLIHPATVSASTYILTIPLHTVL